MRGVLHTACVVAMAAGFAGGPSTAVAAWEEPFPLSQEGEGPTFRHAPEVAAIPDGSFITAWFRPLPGSDDEPPSAVIEARRIDPTGERGPLLTLTSDVADRRRVRVAAGHDGGAFVIWLEIHGDDRIVKARRIGPDGSLGPELAVSEEGDNAPLSDVVVDSAGNATVVWLVAPRPPETANRLRVRRLPATGPPGPIVTLPLENGSFINQVMLAIGPDDRPLVVFEQIGRIKAQRLSTSGEPSGGVATLSDPDDTSQPASVGIDGEGIARVVWGQVNRGRPLITSTRTVAPDGTLGPTSVVTEHDSSGASMGINASGTSAVAWADEESSPNTARAATIRRDGSITSSFQLSPPSSGGAFDTQVGVDASGVATAVWQRGVGLYQVAEVGRFSRAGVLGDPVTLSNPSTIYPEPNVAVQPGGVALATWTQGTNEDDPDAVRFKAARFVPPPIPPGPIPPEPPGPPPTYECHGEPATIVGTSHDNEIVGTPQRDVIDGGPGDDRIKGLGGDDLICGRDGKDAVHGNKGDDAVFAGDGDDRAAGGVGDDALRGQADDDELVGAANADELAAGSGADLSRGARGKDRIHGRAGRDRALGGRGRDGISGGRGEDDLAGGSANDRISGGPQDDFLDGDRGVNKCHGGSGVNVLVRCQR